MSSQVLKHKDSNVFCLNCLNHFPNEEKLKAYKKFHCVRLEMPKLTKDEYGEYVKQIINFKKVAFVVYADFEAFLENIDSCEPVSKTSFA